MISDQAKIFLAAARHLNLTKAAAELRISQPSVSKQLKALEEAFGLKLYNSIGSGIKLTDIGETFRRDMETLYSHLDLFMVKWGPHSRRNGNGVVGDVLNIGGSYSPSAYLLPTVIASFRQSRPHVRIDLRTGPRSIIQQWAISGEVEIGLITTAADSPLLCVEPYRIEKLALFVSARHPLARKPRLTVSELMTYPLVIRGQAGALSRAEIILKELQARGYQPRIAVRCEMPMAVKTAVKEKAGVGILYRGVIEPDLSTGDFKILDVQGLRLESPSFIIYRKDRPRSPSADAFLGLLHQHRRRRRSVNHSLKPQNSNPRQSL